MKEKRANNFDDKTGKRFGKLTVVSLAGFKYYWAKDGKRKKRKKRALWNTVCDCGGNIVVMGYCLTTRNTWSCGCMLAEHRKELNLRKRLPYGTAPMRSVINAYKFGSRKRNIEYALTEEQFKDITTKNCHYCGVTPFHRESGLWDHYQYNGIDRVDNNKGYTLDNCVPCCRPCNWAKMDSTLDEFKLRTKKLYEGFKVRGEL